MSTATVSAAITECLRRARRVGIVASVYLTRGDALRLLEEMGQKPDGRCTKRPLIDRFDDVPVYPEMSFSAVFFTNTGDGQGNMILL